MKRGQTITLTADTLSRHGDGIGNHDGIEVHAAGLLPGETGVVNIDYVSRQNPRAHGSVVSRRNDHPGRRSPPCEHHTRCNGCTLMDLDVPSQRALKTRELHQHYSLDVDRFVGTDDIGLQYRWSSKRVFAGRPGRVILGSYMRGTHNIANMHGCRVDHPDIAAAANELQEVASSVEAAPYQETDQSGDLRYAWFKTDGRGNVLAAIITADPMSPSIHTIADRLKLPIGVAWGVNAAPRNDMRGTTLRPLRGRQTLEISMAGTPVHVGPQGFLQPNPTTAGLAYHDLVHMPAGGFPHGRIALDLYAGAGVTTQMLRDHYQIVVPCESFPESAQILGITPRLVEEFLAEILANPNHPHRNADLVIANPPRGGLGAPVCEQLSRLRAARLHIMSCSPASLSQDLKRLTGPTGGYKLITTRAFDTLPQTAHVEIVAWLVGRW